MEIIKHPDPRLRQVCTALTPEELSARTFSSDMFGPSFSIYEFGRQMLVTCKAANGLGMAAPQVGVMRRMIVCCPKGWELVIVNPVITNRSPQKTSDNEGCLSYPGRLITVVRHRSITWSGFDVKGEPMNGRASGQLATVIQHEIDHLDGVCKVGPKEPV